MQKKQCFLKGVLLSILVTAQVGLSGCSESLMDKPKNQEQVQIEKIKTLSRGQIKIEYTPTQTPNVYSAVLTWPTFDGAIKIRNSENTYVTNDLIVENQFDINNLTGGNEVKYFFETLSKERAQKSEIELTLLPPKDLVLTGVLSLTKDENYTFGRVFLSDDLRIYTNQFRINIKFNTLFIGKNVALLNFPLDKKAAQNTEGLSGGSATLSGENAFGFLKIYINSEFGADGEKGFPRCISFATEEFWHDCFGTNGRNSGARGSFYIELNGNENFDFSYDFVEVRGGVAGEKTINIDRYQRDKICRDWQKITPTSSYSERFKTCDIASTSGSSASGGKICLKLNKDSNYECTEKN